MNLHREIDNENFVIDMLNAQTVCVVRRFAILLGTYTWMSMRKKKEIVWRICSKLKVDNYTCKLGFVLPTEVRMLCSTVIAMDDYPSYADDNTTMQNLRNSKCVEVNINVLQDFQLQKNKIRQQRENENSLNPAIWSDCLNPAIWSDFKLLRKCLNAIHIQISREWYEKQSLQHECRSLAFHNARDKERTHTNHGKEQQPHYGSELAIRAEQGAPAALFTPGHEHAAGIRGDALPYLSKGDPLQYLGDEIMDENLCKTVDNLLMERPAQENFFVPSDADIFRHCSELPGPSVCSMEDAAVFGLMNRNGWLGHIGDKRRRHYDPLPDWRMPHESWDAWYDTGGSVLPH